MFRQREKTLFFYFYFLFLSFNIVYEHMESSTLIKIYTFFITGQLKWSFLFFFHFKIFLRYSSHHNICKLYFHFNYEKFVSGKIDLPTYLPTYFGLKGTLPMSTSVYWFLLNMRQPKDFIICHFLFFNVSWLQSLFSCQVIPRYFIWFLWVKFVLSKTKTNKKNKEHIPAPVIVVIV